MARPESKGREFEDRVRELLISNGYHITEKQMEFPNPLGGNGKRIQRVDVLILEEQNFLVVSLKEQDSVGTANEKIPNEICRLLYLKDSSPLFGGRRLKEIYLVWRGAKLKGMFESFARGDYTPYIPRCGEIRKIEFEEFKKLVLEKKL
jgi:hypothetical protein